MSGFLQRLKERKLVQWAIAYVAGGFALLQGIDIVAQRFGWPESIERALIVALAIGLFVTIVLAWYHGERGAQRVSGTELMILALLLAIGGGALWKFAGTEKGSEALSGHAGAHSKTSRPESDSDAISQADRSIVVLPFADMSQAKDQEYLSDGLAEELLNLLARVPQLRVISRSSAFSYKGKAIDLGTIGRQLDVAHVLEGSVRKAGNAVRITVQLIDARSDAHIWSETYDRPLDNIFAIQDEIAAAVVSKLKITLLGEAPKAAVADPAAYALYLQAREKFRVGSAEAYEAAIRLYKQALAISPDYAQAWEALGDVYVNQAARGMLDTETGIRLGREVSNRALALNPNLARATANLAWIANAYDRDLIAAVRYTERALALDPGSTQVLFAAGLTARSLARLDAAMAIYQRQVALDPANPGPYGQLGKVLAFSGRDAEAIASYRKLIELSPAFAGGRHWLSLVLLKDGHDRAGAEQALALAADEPGRCYRLETLTMAYHALGKTTESGAAMAELTATCEEPASYNIAYAYAFRGDADQAFAWLEKAVQHNDSGLTELVSQPMFAPIHDDPRWLPLLRKLGRAPEQLAAIPFSVTLPR